MRVGFVGGDLVENDEGVVGEAVCELSSFVCGMSTLIFG
jgi:hypothetical protein